MIMSLNSEDFSWRSDPHIADFDDSGPVTVMDAHCALCARGAKWIARNDTDKAFRIIPLQSERGRALMRHYDMDADDPLGWLYLENGRAYSSLDATIRVARRLGGIWKSLALLRLMPRPLQDRLYRLVARNRYRWFGRADLCNLPDPEVRERLLL